MNFMANLFKITKDNKNTENTTNQMEKSESPSKSSIKPPLNKTCDILTEDLSILEKTILQPTKSPEISPSDELDIENVEFISKQRRWTGFQLFDPLHEDNSTEIKDTDQLITKSTDQNHIDFSLVSEDLDVHESKEYISDVFNANLENLNSNDNHRIDKYKIRDSFIASFENLNLNVSTDSSNNCTKDVEFIENRHSIETSNSSYSTSTETSDLNNITVIEQNENNSSESFVSTLEDTNVLNSTSSDIPSDILDSDVSESNSRLINNLSLQTKQSDSSSSENTNNDVCLDSISLEDNVTEIHSQEKVTTASCSSTVFYLYQYTDEVLREVTQQLLNLKEISCWPAILLETNDNNSPESIRWVISPEFNEFKKFTHQLIQIYECLKRTESKIDLFHITEQLIDFFNRFLTLKKQLTNEQTDTFINDCTVDQILAALNELKHKLIKHQEELEYPENQVALLEKSELLELHRQELLKLERYLEENNPNLNLSINNIPDSLDATFVSSELVERAKEVYESVVDIDLPLYNISPYPSTFEQYSENNTEISIDDIDAIHLQLLNSIEESKPLKTIIIEPSAEPISEISETISLSTISALSNTEQVSPIEDITEILQNQQVVVTELVESLTKEDTSPQSQRVPVEDCLQTQTLFVDDLITSTAIQSQSPVPSNSFEPHETLLSENTHSLTNSPSLDTISFVSAESIEHLPGHHLLKDTENEKFSKSDSTFVTADSICETIDFKQTLPVESPSSSSLDSTELTENLEENNLCLLEKDSNPELNNSSFTQTLQMSDIPLETSKSNKDRAVIETKDYINKESDVKNCLEDRDAISTINQKLEEVQIVNQIMEEQIVNMESDNQNLKESITKLKDELRTIRQKSADLEKENQELKQRENEYTILIAEYKNKSSTKDSGSIGANETAIVNEINDLKAVNKQLENNLREMQRKESKLIDELKSKQQSEKEISIVMEEYERSLSSLVTERENMKSDRDTAQMHLANIELAFSDLHQKYERCKTIVKGYKDNEDSLKKNIALNEDTILKQEQKYDTLKAHAMAQLERSNQELAEIRKQHDQELARVTAQVKRYEIKNNSLMEALQQKSKECEQLSAVCDEFIGNV